jgi:hypothetical protein
MSPEDIHSQQLYADQRGRVVRVKMHCAGWVTYEGPHVIGGARVEVFAAEYEPVEQARENDLAQTRR